MDMQKWAIPAAEIVESSPTTRYVLGFGLLCMKFISWIWKANMLPLSFTEQNVLSREQFKNG